MLKRILIPNELLWKLDEIVICLARQGRKLLLSRTSIYKITFGRGNEQKYAVNNKVGSSRSISPQRAISLSQDVQISLGTNFSVPYCSLFSTFILEEHRQATENKLIRA